MTTPVQPIPPPHVLDPDRLLRNDRTDMTDDDHRTRSQLLEAALHETCAYARQLWDNLDALRHYLIDSLPPDPRSPGPHRTASASPTGPDDEQGWENWIAAYASINSVLCGPQGDSGYGLSEARHTAQERRSAPNLNLFAEHSALSRPPETQQVTPHRPEQQAAAHALTRPMLRAAATTVLVLLATRGLRRRRPAAR